MSTLRARLEALAAGEREAGPTDFLFLDVRGSDELGDPGLVRLCAAIVATQATHDDVADREPATDLLEERRREAELARLTREVIGLLRRASLMRPHRFGALVAQAVAALAVGERDNRGTPRARNPADALVLTCLLKLIEDAATGRIR